MPGFRTGRFPDKKTNEQDNHGTYRTRPRLDARAVPRSAAGRAPESGLREDLRKPCRRRQGRAAEPGLGDGLAPRRGNFRIPSVTRAGS